MRLLTALIAALILMLSVTAPLSAQNLLINGSFELPGLPDPGDRLQISDGSTFLPGWVSVDNIPAGALFVDNFVQRTPYSGFPASDGSHFVYIDNNNGPSPSLNGIYQEFSTETGLQYRVTFDASTELGYGNPGLLRVSAGNASVQYTLPNVPGYPEPYVFTGWSSYDFTFTAISNSTRLQFFDEGFQIGGNPITGNSSPLIDNVAVNQIPEPMSSLCIAIGCVVINTRRKRTK